MFNDEALIPLLQAPRHHLSDAADQLAGLRPNACPQMRKAALEPLRDDRCTMP